MRAISPFRDDIDDTDLLSYGSGQYHPVNGTGAGTGALPRAVPRFESSPVVSFRLGGAGPTTFLSQVRTIVHASWFMIVVGREGNVMIFSNPYYFCLTKLMIYFV